MRYYIYFEFYETPLMHKGLQDASNIAINFTSDKPEWQTTHFHRIFSPQQRSLTCWRKIFQVIIVIYLSSIQQNCIAYTSKTRHDQEDKITWTLKVAASLQRLNDLIRKMHCSTKTYQRLWKYLRKKRKQ